ncbi:hypothetical protein BS78_02G070600 [Paspalum vaginatum]|nr:hypothetical protein BS78_02G070600 [Paspalum vaginatum]
MATRRQQSSSPWFFNFLKEGLLLPTHNPRLFAVLFSIIVASTTLLVLGNDLSVQPLADEIRRDINALNSTDLGSQDYIHLVQEIQDDTRELLLTGAAYLLLSVIVGSAVRVLILFAAVATYSGELLSFGSLLGKVRAQLKGPLLTLAFVYALETACVVLVAAMAGLLVLLVIKRYLAVFFVGSLLLLAAFVFLIYFSILCSVSVVVAVAEPGCHGAGAVARAWRLIKGKRRRAVLLISATGVLAAAVSPVHTLAAKCALSSMASGLLLDFVYTVLMAAVQLFAICAMAAFCWALSFTSMSLTRSRTPAVAQSLKLTRRREEEDEQYTLELATNAAADERPVSWHLNNSRRVQWKGVHGFIAPTRRTRRCSPRPCPTATPCPCRPASTSEHLGLSLPCPLPCATDATPSSTRPSYLHAYARLDQHRANAR